MKPAWTTLSMSKLEAVRGVKPMNPAWTTLSMFKVEAVRGVKPTKPAWATLSMSMVEAVRGVKPMKPAVDHSIYVYGRSSERGEAYEASCGPLYLCLR